MTRARDRALLTRLILVVATVGCFVGLTFMGALHSPEPNGLQLGIVGTQAQAAQVSSALEANAPDAFDTTSFTTVQRARDAVLDRDVVAAYAQADGRARIIVASGGGALSRDTAIRLGEQLAAQSGAQVQVTDVAPLPDEDRAGLSPFLLVVSILIPSLLSAAVLVFGAPKARPRARLSAALGGGLLLGLLNTAVIDVVLGALPGHYWELAGLTTLTSWAITLPLLGLHRLMGPPGVGLGALLFAVIGVPTSGAAVGPSFLPDLFQYLTLAFPAGEAIPAVRSVAYFEGAGITPPLLLLAGWALAGAAVLTFDRSAARPVPRPDRGDGASLEGPASYDPLSAAAHQW